MPLLVMQAVLAARYSYLDTICLKAERAYLTNFQFQQLGTMRAKRLSGGSATGPTPSSRCLGDQKSVNVEPLEIWMACFPMLLVITAEFDSWVSTKAFLLQSLLDHLRSISASSWRRCSSCGS